MIVAARVGERRLTVGEGVKQAGQATYPTLPYPTYLCNEHDEKSSVHAADVFVVDGVNRHLAGVKGSWERMHWCERVC